MGPMGKGFILWLLGVPASIPVLLWFRYLSDVPSVEQPRLTMRRVIMRQTYICRSGGACYDGAASLCR